MRHLRSETGLKPKCTYKQDCTNTHAHNIPLSSPPTFHLLTNPQYCVSLLIATDPVVAYNSSVPMAAWLPEMFIRLEAMSLLWYQEPDYQRPALSPLLHTAYRTLHIPALFDSCIHQGYLLEACTFTRPQPTTKAAYLRLAFAPALHQHCTQITTIAAYRRPALSPCLRTDYQLYEPHQSVMAASLRLTCQHACEQTTSYTWVTDTPWHSI